MKKPKQYDLKKWLFGNCVIGLKIHYAQTGVDTAETYWELIPEHGKSKRVLGRSVKGLVLVEPGHLTIMELHQTFIAEVEEYEAFLKTEAEDLAEYERLKAKFGRSSLNGKEKVIGE